MVFRNFVTKLGLLALGALVAPIVAYAGFGVSPASIIEERAIPGASFSRVIYLVQGVPDAPVAVEISVESRDIKDWITVGKGNRITIPSGVQQFPIPVSITIPQGTPLGNYTAFIRIRTIPDPADQSGEVAISLGGRVDVSLTVGDNVVEEFSVKNIQILSIEEREVPRVALTVENTGNVAVAPDSVSFELFDKFGDIRLAYGRVSFDDFEKTPAFSEKKYTVEFPFNIVLAPGEYWGHTKVYAKGGSSARELRTVFDVYPRSVSAVGDAATIMRDLPPIMMIGLILVLLALILLFALLLVKRRSSTPSSDA